MPTPSFTDIIKAYLEAQFGGDVPPIPGITIDSELSDTSENPVQNKVINAALQSKGTYSKPSGGIPKSDLASGVQTSLGKADTAYQKPASGIPASDLATGVIPAVPRMATQTDMSDWTQGKTVDAAVLKADFAAAVLEVNDLQANKADKSDTLTVRSCKYNPDNTYFSTDVLFTRVGNVVEVRYIGNLTLVASTFKNIINFAPDGYRPSDPTDNKAFPVCLLCFVPNGNNGRFLFRLFKDGNLSMYNYGAAMSGSMFYMSGTYITADNMPST